MSKNKPNRFFLGIVALISVPIGLAGAYGVKAVQSRHLISSYLSSHAVRKLQIGAGGAPGFDDWLNTDIEPRAGQAYLDATKPFPIPDGVLSYIFSEQVFEHLSYRGWLVNAAGISPDPQIGRQDPHHHAELIAVDAIVPG